MYKFHDECKNEIKMANDNVEKIETLEKKC